MVAEQCESARLHRHVAKRYAYALQPLVQHLQKIVGKFLHEEGSEFVERYYITEYNMELVELDHFEFGGVCYGCNYPL